MHIFYIHQHFAPPLSYGNNRSWELAAFWQGCGNKVTVVCGSGNFADRLPFYILYKIYYYDGVQVIRLNISYSHYYSFYKRIFSFIKFLILNILLLPKFKKANIVYASSTPLTVGIVGIVGKKLLGKKFIFEIVDLWPDVPIQMGVIRSPMLVKILLYLEKVIYKEAAHVVVLSEGMKDALADKNILESKVSVMHNGTNCNLFYPIKEKKNVKETLNFSDTDFIVLYAGTIGLANGLEFLLDTASAIKSSGIIHIKFLLIGDGNAKDKILKIAQDRDLTNVYFFNSVPKDNVSVFFQAADIGMVCFAPFPILNTNSANKFFDYLASGLPVCINYDGWQQPYLEDNRCGFASNNPVEMAKKIIELQKSPEIKIKYSINARKLAVERFNRKEISSSLLALFSKVTSNS